MTVYSTKFNLRGSMLQAHVWISTRFILYVLPLCVILPFPVRNGKLKTVKGNARQT